MKTLREVISRTVMPTEADLALCENFFEKIQVLRNTVLEEQGKTPQYLYFIVLGFMRLFYQDKEGCEQTSFIAAPNGFLASFLSFINRVDAPESIESVTDCKLLRITHANLRLLIDQSENFKKFSLVIFQEAMAAASMRADDLATLTAEQRYRKMIEKQPGVINNVPVQYIASYLGIKPQSLSRIRRQIK